MGLLRLGGSNPPLSDRFDKPPYGGFFVTGIHERRRRAPVIGIHGKVFSHVAACRSEAPALYPTPGIGPQPCTTASCICPYFPSPAPCGVLFSLTTALSGTTTFTPVAPRRAANDRTRHT